MSLRSLVRLEPLSVVVHERCLDEILLWEAHSRPHSVEFRIEYEGWVVHFPFANTLMCEISVTAKFLKRVQSVVLDDHRDSEARHHRQLVRFLHEIALPLPNFALEILILQTLLHLILL